MEKGLDIAGRKIGRGRACFIIAEAGINHNCDLSIAHQMIDAAARAGASAIKFQTFKADRLVTSADPQGKSQWTMLRDYELSEDAHRQLWDYCNQKKFLFISSPFDERSADFLDGLGMAAFKIASGELTHLKFLAHVARKKKPMIVSTGMATLEEVERAVSAIREAGNSEMALLHCVSNYPAHPKEANLRAMQTLAEKFKVPVGFSDHTLGIEIALAAAALGACVIEKHFTLDSSLPGPDQGFSLEPHDMSELVRCVRNIESALGDGQKIPTASELQTARGARKSLVAARLIKAGVRLTEELIDMKRPGTGLPPTHLNDVVGRTAKTDIPEGAILSLDMLT